MNVHEFQKWLQERGYNLPPEYVDMLNKDPGFMGSFSEGRSLLGGDVTAAPPVQAAAGAAPAASSSAGLSPYEMAGLATASGIGELARILLAPRPNAPAPNVGGKPLIATPPSQSIFGQEPKFRSLLAGYLRR